MPVPFTSKIVAKESVLINTFDDGESVLLNLDTDNYFGLNDGGSEMWELLVSLPSVEVVFTTLVEKYCEVESDIIQRDLTAFVDELMEHELVELSPPKNDAH